MGLTYNGITHRSLEEQVRYDAEQVQLLKQADVTINENLQILKQADVTINENLQTVNTEISGKLTKPANPSAESAVTMLADGTVGTKLLSEIGGGGSWRYDITITNKSAGREYAMFSIFRSTQTNYDINSILPLLHTYIECVCGDSNTNVGPGFIYLVGNKILISGIAAYSFMNESPSSSFTNITVINDISQYELRCVEVEL